MNPSPSTPLPDHDQESESMPGDRPYAPQTTITMATGATTILLNSIKCAVTMSHGEIRVGHIEITPDALEYLAATWHEHFGPPTNPIIIQ